MIRILAPRHRIVAVVTAIVLAFLVFPPNNTQAFFPKDWDTLDGLLGTSHESITTQAITQLDKQFFSVAKISKSMKKAMQQIADADADVDKDQGTPELHFDGETFAKGQARVVGLLQTVQVDLANNDASGARTALGQALHTIQDFYSHTNWIEEGNTSPNSALGRPGQTIPTLPTTTPTCVACIDHTLRCPDCSKNLLPNGLTSGYYSGENHDKPIPGKCSHGGPFDGTSSDGGGINKDSSSCKFSPHSANNASATSVAIAATQQFITDIKALVTPTQLKLLLGVGPSLVISIDTTGSMSDIIAGVQQAAIQIVESRIGTDQEPSQYVLAPFNDPSTGPVTVTDDPDVFEAAISALGASGGGDCPELSVTGMIQGMGAANAGGDLFMFTDASAKDGDLAGQASSLAVSKEIQVYPMSFGDCSEPSSASANTSKRHTSRRASNAPVADPAFVQIASSSGGQVFSLQRSEAGTVTSLADFVVKSDSVTLLSIEDTLSGTAKSYPVPVDSVLTPVVFSVSGTTDLTVTRPDGSVVQPTDPGVTFVSLSSGAIYSIANPPVGNWNSSVNATGAFSLIVTGESTLELSSFRFVQPGGRPGHSGYYPIPGFPTGATANADAVIDGTFNTAQFSFRDKTGTQLQALTLSPGSGDFANEFIGTANLPATGFLIYVTGTDGSGAVYQRALPGTFLQQSVQVTPPPAQDLVPGTATSYVFQVQNLGAPDTFQLSGGDDQNYVQSISPPSVTLAANQTANVTVQILPPVTATPGTSDTLTLTATGTTGTTNFAILTSFVVSSAPAVQSYSPQGGPVGALVSIVGTGFGASQGSSSVLFNGTSAGMAQLWSDTELQVTVPAGATTGNLVVTVGTQSSNTEPFTVTPPPKIASSCYQVAKTEVVIQGTNLTAGGFISPTVTFNGTVAIPTSATDKLIHVLVPAGIKSATVMVNVDGVNSNAVPFQRSSGWCFIVH